MKMWNAGTIAGKFYLVKWAKLCIIAFCIKQGALKTRRAVENFQL